MLLLIPVAGALLLVLLVATHASTMGFPGTNRRGAVVVAFLLFQLITLVITEALSVGAHYTRTSVGLAWSLVVVCLGLLIWRARRSAGPGAYRLPRIDVRLGADVAIGSVVLAVIFIVLVITGWLYPPANTDSLAYHLPRVEHWIQNESVASYGTHYLHQIELAPLMEYNLATLHLLLGSDRLDGYVQLTSLVVGALAASDLARRLGIGTRGQIFAALLVVTAQNALLEATSTTNGDFAGAVAICTLWLATAPLGEAGWKRRSLALGLAGGLIELSKGTMVALFGPVILVLLILALRRGIRAWGTREALARAAGAVVLAAVAAALVAGPFVARNVTLFGGPAGPVSAFTVNEELSPAAGFSNSVRQTSSQFLIGDGSGVQHEVSRVLTSALGSVYGWLGQDPEDDRFTLVPNPDPFAAADFSMLSRFEDIGANPWHTILLAITLVALVVDFVRRGRRAAIPLLLALALVAGFLVLSMTAKWSIYGTRYYVPLLMVWAPLMAFGLRRLPHLVTRGVAVLLVVACVPPLLDNYTRSLVHRRHDFTTPLQPYFAGSPTEEEARARALHFEQLTQGIARSNCDEIGLANIISYEYVLWAGLDHWGWDGTIQSWGAPNDSGALEDPAFEPCAIVFDHGSVLPPDLTTVPDGMTRYDYGPLSLLLADVMHASV